MICILLSMGTLAVRGQEGRHYRVENNTQIDEVSFTLSATSGSCSIKPTKGNHPINIFGNPESEKVTPTFNTWIHNGIQQVTFNLEENKPVSIGKKLSYSVFNEQTNVEDKKWHIYISESKPIFLNLNYGIGEADVDLSGLSIKKLKINTGSADVNVSYLSGKMNKIEMDTFMVAVDMGTLNVGKVNLSRAKNIIADVGFGSLTLDLSDKSTTRSTIYASVGAGNLVVTIPKTNTPMVIYINNSPLCHIQLSENFKEIKPNVYANENYKENASNLLSFDLDVALGKISFVSQ